jgi:hypothetical protein
VKYFFKSNRFMEFGDDNKFSECNLGTDKDGYIYYPNVSTCTTLTLLLQSNALVGVHFDKGSTVGEVQTMVKKMDELRRGSAITNLHLVGVLEFGKSGGWMGDKTYVFPKLFKQFALDLSYTGPVYAYAQPLNTEKHYNVRVLGPQTVLWYYKDVGQKQMGKGTASQSLSETPGPWKHFQPDLQT